MVDNEALKLVKKQVKFNVFLLYIYMIYLEFYRGKLHFIYIFPQITYLFYLKTKFKCVKLLFLLII